MCLTRGSKSHTFEEGMMDSVRLSESTPLVPSFVTLEKGEVNDKAVSSLKLYSTKDALALTINCIIGTGAFGLPYAFRQAGIGLTTCILVIGGLLACITVNYTLEFLSRAAGVLTAGWGERPENRLTYTKYDFAQVGGVFSGERLRKTIQWCMWAYALGTLWSYASVFSSTSASMIYAYGLGQECDIFGSPSTGCEWSYLLSMAIFAAAVVCLALMDVGEQTKVQNFLAGYRVVVLTVMILTLVAKLMINPSVARQTMEVAGGFNWSNFAAGFGPALLALTMQYQMPDLLQPLDRKENARMVMFAGLTFSIVVYLALGIMGALAFETVNPLASLNWKHYTGCGDGWGKCATPSIWATLVQMAVLLFPVFNVLSAFPVICITIGDNMLASTPQTTVDTYGPNLKFYYRLATALPPLVLATIFKKLNTVFTLAGLLGFVLSLLLPTWLQYISTVYYERRWPGKGSSSTRYTIPFISGKIVSFSMFCLSVVALIVGIATVKL